jgi:hypothetical protein
MWHPSHEPTPSIAIQRTFSHIYDYVTDRPAFTVDNKFFDMADTSVRRLNIVADDFVGATQVGIG